MAASGPRKCLPPPVSPLGSWQHRVLANACPRQVHPIARSLSSRGAGVCKRMPRFNSLVISPEPKWHCAHTPSQKKRLRRPGSPHSKQSILAPGAPPTAKYRPQLLSNISGTKMALARQPKKAACPRQVHPIARSLSPRSLRPYNWMPDLNSSVTPLDQNGITPHPPSPWQMDPHVLPWPGSCRNHLK